MSEDEHNHCKGRGHGLSCREISEFLLAYTERELDGDDPLPRAAAAGRRGPCGARS